jgi:hypothetical protein
VSFFLLNKLCELVVYICGANVTFICELLDVAWVTFVPYFSLS